jgi:hypothetical protein
VTADPRPRVNAADPRRRLDRAGRAQFTRRTTQAEIDRRDVWIAKLFRKGHTTVEIAVGLDCARETIGQRLKAMGFDRTKRYKGLGPVKGPCPWRDEDVPPPKVEPLEARWRRSQIIGMAQMLNDEYRESNFANVLANQATDAEEAGDKDWLIEALATINAAIEKLGRARRVLADDTYRAACRDTLEGVESMRRKQPRQSQHPTLRAVRSGE